MIKLWNWLIYGHDHDWEELSFFNVSEVAYAGDKLGHYKHYITYRCTVCKRHKREVAEGLRK